MYKSTMLPTNNERVQESLSRGNHTMPSVIYSTPIPLEILVKSPWRRLVLFCQLVSKTLG